MSEVEDFRDELIDKLRQKNMELAMANLNIKFLLGGRTAHDTILHLQDSKRELQVLSNRLTRENRKLKKELKELEQANMRTRVNPKYLLAVCKVITG